jgi:hypothetical protein
MALNPDQFSLSPLFAVLPSLGNVSRLESLVSALFARFEAVEALREHIEAPEARSKLGNEAAMLRQILDWLAVQPEEGEEGGSDE